MNTLNTTRLISLTLLILIVAGIFMAAAFLQSKVMNPITDRPIIAATIFPLADITQHIAGDHFAVVQLIPAGVSEHSAALSPEQLRHLQSAKALFAIGHALDTTLTDKVVHAILTLKPITVDDGIALREFTLIEEEHVEEEQAEGEEEHPHDTGLDPHYWLTVPNGQLIAANIARELTQLDPAHASDYAENLQTYVTELQILEQELQTMAAAAPTKEFFAMHNAWGYLADQYGLNLVATYEPVEGRDPSINDLNNLQNIITEHNIRVFYSEPQKETVGAVRLLEHDFGLEVRLLDPVGGLPPYDSYINLMRENLRALSTPIQN